MDRFNSRLGRLIAWLALAMVLVQFAVVLLRYVFAVGFTPMQESVWHLHGLVFMLGAGYTLLHHQTAAIKRAETAFAQIGGKNM
ncbi:MAG: hypothetical protein GY935_12965 [Gammaproteobacteria bacterium]|nr:hypothetical protein [Gammaproteobacteria bacterium]